MKVHLDIDVEQGVSGACWYPCAAEANNVWYTMPHIGARVNVHIWDMSEMGLVMTLARGTEGEMATTKSMSKPTEKRMETKWAGVLALQEGSIEVGIPAVNVSLDEASIEVVSNDRISVESRTGLAIGRVEFEYVDEQGLRQVDVLQTRRLDIEAAELVTLRVTGSDSVIQLGANAEVYARTNVEFAGRSALPAPVHEAIRDTMLRDGMMMAMANISPFEFSLDNLKGNLRSIIYNGRIHYSIRDIFESLDGGFVNFDRATNMVVAGVSRDGRKLTLSFNLNDVRRNIFGIPRTGIIIGTINMYVDGNRQDFNMPTPHTINVLYHRSAVTYVIFADLAAYFDRVFPANAAGTAAQVVPSHPNPPPTLYQRGTTLRPDRNTAGRITDHNYLQNNYYFTSTLDAVHAFGILYFDESFHRQIEMGAIINRWLRWDNRDGYFYTLSRVALGTRETISVDDVAVVGRYPIAWIHTHPHTSMFSRADYGHGFKRPTLQRAYLITPQNYIVMSERRANSDDFSPGEVGMYTMVFGRDRVYHTRGCEIGRITSQGIVYS